MKISIIVAVAQNNVIGGKGKLLWHISDDLKHFKEVTMGHHILMGKTTYESIGRILPGRTSLILSHDKNLKVPDGYVFENEKEAIDFAEKNGENELMIIGGESIYKLFFSKADKIYLTKVLKEFDGDVTFPEINMEEWRQTKKEPHPDENPPFEFIELERK
ncbi:MAG: dihydrofolate reductase [uncultured bacterium]|uniref:Dihydrofolate reductase n=1 Tax=Candidatus Woesebacteria bacterium GW2011_GWA1_40_43 TaxID=1618553 RepID=A0A0G0SE95_9BACT|nr:MAG: dihydrofolate reductase [uncultured bacterium]KKR57522.1 MAG: Dihydrofolate reductase [Candidatus Woesebacteria bacterium GW2011_GWC2_40_30]KKR63164.1 MAG: Dihydrofolate reductase [Candidatus Woesebacteria bacterium GW2011_GWA1_40_43]HAU65620.1 dihydrofolate reductase [Candidatus Woesebacteria bacterium]HCC08951.1 dihydrofolate reductase [Candidatus Woesebacteria bacterium]